MPCAEIRQNLESLIGTSFSLAAGVYAQTTGWTQVPLAPAPINVLWAFVAALFLHDAWFYFSHRPIHTKPLYRWYKTHHLSGTPTVWNNDSFSVPDALSVQSFFILLPFVLPIPTAALIALRLFDQTKAMIGHSGYEYFAGRLARWPLPFVATVHHHQHTSASLIILPTYSRGGIAFLAGLAHPKLKRFEFCPIRRKNHMHSTDSIQDWPIHVYFDDGSRSTAEAVRTEVETGLPGPAIGPCVTNPSARTSQGSFQVFAPNDKISEVSGWVALNRQGLTILMHPNAADGLKEHRDYPIWCRSAPKMNN